MIAWILNKATCWKQKKKSLKVPPFLFGVQSSGTAKSTSDYTIIRSTMCTKKLTVNYVDLFCDVVHTQFTSKCAVC